MNLKVFLKLELKQLTCCLSRSEKRLKKCFPLSLKATEAAWEGHSVHSQQTVDCSFDIENTSFYFLHLIFFYYSIKSGWRTTWILQIWDRYTNILMDVHFSMLFMIINITEVPDQSFVLQSCLIFSCFTIKSISLFLALQFWRARTASSALPTAEGALTLRRHQRATSALPWRHIPRPFSRTSCTHVKNLFSLECIEKTNTITWRRRFCIQRGRWLWTLRVELNTFKVKWSKNVWKHNKQLCIISSLTIKYM